MIQKMSKKHQVLCTSRNYREVIGLAKLRKINLLVIGKHGGATRKGKLISSTQRMARLAKVISNFSPDLTISFCTPDVSRISYGLGIKHIAFSDSPHAEAVMRLSVPLVQKLLIPWIIPKNEFTKYGISEKNIIQYRAIDASVMVKEKSSQHKMNTDKSRRTIVIRPEESQASYTVEKTSSYKIIEKICKKSSDYNIIVLARYPMQKKDLKSRFGKKIKVMEKVVDGKSLLSVTDLFIGSGGTMTAESALMGIPTISYNAVPNYIEDYLVKIGIVRRESNPKRIISVIECMLNEKETIRKKARKVLNTMEDPYLKLTKTIQQMN
jgi:predicted glycosyltransferase